MKCPICVRENKRSKLYITNEILWPNLEGYYDEDGNWTNPEGKSTTDYSCTNGHAFTIEKNEGKETITYYEFKQRDESEP